MKRLLAQWWGRLLRGFFYLLYHQMAFSYDLVAWLVSLGRWQGWVAQACQYLDQPPILELGFGPGHLQQKLLEAGKTAFGLDESRFMCRLAARRLRKNSNLGSPPALCRGLAQNLPFASGSLKSIVATFPSEYIFDEVTIHECARVLSPGGQLIILAAVEIGGRTLAERLLRGLFHITHQSGDPQETKQAVSDRFSRHEFSVNFERRECGDDWLWFIRLQKVVSPLCE